MSAPTVEIWSGSNALELKNSLVVRNAVLPSDWNTIRLGMLCGFSSGSFSSISNSLMAFGICSGSNNVFGDSVCGHFLGMKITGSAWTYNSSSTYNSLYYDTLTAYMTRKASGSADINSTDIVGNMYFMVQDPYTGRSRLPVYLEITKGSPNYSVTAWFQTLFNRSDNGYVTIDDFYQHLLKAEPSPPYSQTGKTGPYTLAVNETLSGSFDSINIAWNQEAPSASLLIYALGIAVMS